MYVVNYCNGKTQANQMFHNLAIALIVSAHYRIKGLQVTLLHIKGSVKEVF